MSLHSIRVLEHESSVLKGNPMGNKTARRIPIYLPPGYNENRSEPYPVVHILSGWGGRGARYLHDEGAFCESIPDRLDALIESGAMKPAVIVFPDGTTKLGCSQYVNSPANGRFMDYICDELVSLVESQFNVHRDARYRGVLGHSSGGFGSLVIGMMRPDRFLHICSSAGDGAYEYLYSPPIPMMVGILQKAGGVKQFLDQFLASPNPAGLLSRNDGETMMNLSMCPCYAPNLDKPPLLGDLYFDLETGEIIPEVWEKFLAWDPVRMVDRHVENLKRLRSVYLESGTEDEYGLHLAHRRISKKLKELGIPCVVEEYPGKHGGHHHRMPERIRRMVGQMYVE